ncbi:hypothetical protein QYE76_005044 [Lolium multiflorum]|jgi:hypothetical protein|uniref:Uncharacterized protein n=1 Tax=Lolium multiflorum TaxID=4521 RepID=A0AAD8PYG3_LOLMU|nr:hypothetical protein QYE76_018764 [Lolium multiflorum]KAK1630729.1 hypothetical protein QYE76_005044 [Lolium multiflorum]
MEAIAVAAALQADEPAIDETAPAFDATTPMAGSKLAASTGENKKANVPKKPLSREEKFVQTAKRQGRHANLKEKQRQHVAKEAITLAATTLAYQMQATANTHVRLPPATMPKTMLLIKQERIVANALRSRGPR